MDPIEGRLADLKGTVAGNLRRLVATWNPGDGEKKPAFKTNETHSENVIRERAPHDLTPILYSSQASVCVSTASHTSHVTYSGATSGSASPRLSGEKGREMVGGRNVLVHSGFMAIHCVVSRLKV